MFRLGLRDYTTSVMPFFNPLRPSYAEDPYPALARLRAQDPVFFSHDLNAWIVTRYAECSLALHDTARFRSDFLAAEGPRWAVARARNELFLGGVPALSAMAEPDHHRMRETVSAVFAPRAVQRLRERIVDAVDGLLAGLAPGEPFEVMRGLAYPLPRMVIAEQLGIPETDRAEFQAHADAIARAIFGGAEPAEVARASEARDALLAYVARLHADPESLDLSGALARMIDAFTGGTLSQAEVVGLAVDVAMAGNDPTACLIGNGLLALLRHPDQIDLVRGEPALMADATDEFARFDSPLHALMRIAAEDVELAQKVIRRGDVVYLMVGAANRDPAQFADPDRLDVRRENRRHLGFGAGAHFCLGSPLGRLEAEVALSTLITRYPTLHLAGRGAEYEPEFEMRGPRRLTVAYD